MQVFEMFGAQEEWPLLIFARDGDQAGSIYADWVRAHRPSWSAEPMIIHRFNDEVPTHQVLSVTQESVNYFGVGVWDELEQAFEIREPRTAGDKNLFRPAGHVRYFRVACGEDELMIFARHAGEAVRFFERWYADAMGFKIGVITVFERSQWTLTPALHELHEAMLRGDVGVARWDEDAGWTIVDPEDGQIIPAHLR